MEAEHDLASLISTINSQFECSLSNQLGHSMFSVVGLTTYITSLLSISSEAPSILFRSHSQSLT